METDEVTDKELSEMIADLMAYGSLAGSHEAVYGAHPVSRIAAAAGRILNPGRSSMPLDNHLWPECERIGGRPVPISAADSRCSKIRARS